MAKSTLKTLPNKASVKAFLESVEPETKRQDSQVLLKLFTQATKLKAQMWGDAIVGFGMYHYKSERSNQEGDWPLTGFSPRKQNLTIYIMPGFDDYQDLIKQLGKCKTSVSCIYVNKLSDIDLNILKKIIIKSVKHMKKLHGVK